jgi:predicted glycosyltransferase
MYRAIRCPLLIIHGDDDRIMPYAKGQKVAEITGAELVTIEGGGHIPLGRVPAKCNTAIIDFLRRIGVMPKPRTRTRKAKTVLYLSSPIGLGHARRDLAITRELRKLHPDLEIHWLAQDPVTRLLERNGECVHPLSQRLASETQHIEQESGEHELHCFQALRRMDEVLIKNFMHFQQAVEEADYNLVIADEAWDIDHYWHEHPELKRAGLAWFTDFVGYLPMPSGGEREAYLTTDYNAEMIGHVETHPSVRDRAIFVGSVEDVIPRSFGEGLPAMRDWVPRHFDFSGYIIGEHPRTFGDRKDLRHQLGYLDGERVCIVTVGGSGVGSHLIRRILQSYPLAAEKMAGLRMIVVAGPRIDPGAFAAPPGVELRPFVPDLDRHLAACDLALVQGGLTTCMELTAAGTPFIYFPLKNHFEQNFHVAHRLDRYRAGRRMELAGSTPETIAEAMVAELRRSRNFLPVEADGAARAACLPNCCRATPCSDGQYQ